ncbi:MAG: NAD-dependent epimerase/dehydratase family protein, partial [Bacteroidales bacterium]|nr:NAD-dependent epimerase/dehydratase family protein [Bacteroidales bacterium]
KPLSPYAITKYVNELYADVFARTYGMECIGLRYFNVFGRKQDPNGAYAAVIPLFVKQLINHEPVLINGDGEYSRDFTYINNVIQMNLLAMTTYNPEAINTVYNTAFGERTTLNELMAALKNQLAVFDPAIATVKSTYGPNRAGDIPYSLASIDKAKILLGYDPKFSIQQGLQEAVSWYWENILDDAAEKDLWVNPINAAEVLEQFPIEKIQEIAWLGEPPSTEWLSQRIKQIITGILDGSENIPAPN